MRTLGDNRPPKLFAWDVRTADSGRSGVTDDRDVAIRHVHRALRGFEAGASGRVRRVVLAPDGSAAYVDLRTVGEAWRDAATGAIVWRGE